MQDNSATGLPLITGKVEKPQRVVIYGPEGIGKSTLAAAFPEPVFLDTEGGTIHLNVTRFAQPQNWEDILGLVAQLGQSEHNFQTLVIDTVDWLERLLIEHICRKARTIDAIEFCLSLKAVELADYEPELPWEGKPPSDRQLITLAKAGFDTDCESCRGHASKILDLLFMRREHGLATPKQLSWLRKFHYPEPELATFEEAQLFLDEHFNRKAM